MIASATLRKRGMDPTLEAIALGHAEGLLIYNPTPERDSIFEILPSVVDPRVAEAKRLARMIVDVRNLNGQQGEEIKDVCGWLDGLATDLADREVNDPVRQAIGSRSLARALRPHLATIVAADRVDSTVLVAIRNVDRIASKALRQQVLSPAVERELGAAKFAVLRDIVGEQVQS